MLRVVDESEGPPGAERAWRGLGPRLGLLAFSLVAASKDPWLLAALGMVAVVLALQFLLTAVCTADLRRAAAGDDSGLE